MLEAFFKKEGRPCLSCSSMRLTEEKFNINEYSKHQRVTRTVTKDSGKPGVESLVHNEDMEFGPNGFRLGTLKEIHSRHKECPFCRLVTHSLAEQSVKKRGGEIPVTEQTVDDWPEKNAICYASWQVDGRILKRDAEGQITSSRACTRRIRLHWDWPEFFDTYIVLMAQPTRESPGLFLGQTLQSARIDPAKIRQWTEYCVGSHGSRCHGKSHDFSQWKSFFGVIDVNDMRLTSLPNGARYIALSYMWGSGRVFTTKEENIKSLLSHGGIRKNLSALPRTIRDSIDLVRALGERYLWVDALCIIQDSKRSWTLNSRVMDLVYGNAYLTICAADGQDANAGLQGLHPSLQPTQIIEQYSPEVRLMATQPAENYIRQSVWNTRAWTFQERLLSKRTLIFVSGRVYFQCRCTARSVDIITEDESAGWSIEFIDSPLLMLQQLSDSPLSVYKKALELYMTRNLTFPKDILAAFNGIGNQVCEALGGSLIHGLPSSHFDWALLWEARDAPKRRIDESKDPEVFPSWSWCGWKGEMMEYKPHVLSGCEENLQDWLMNHTWITWYIRDYNGNLRLVWDGDDDNRVPRRRDNTWRGYHRSKDLDTQEKDDYDKYGRYIQPKERSLRRSAFDQILSECPYGVSIVESSSSTQSIRNSPEKDLPYLQFHTWSAFFRIREEPQQDFGKKFQRYSILDYKDDWCGTIVLERLWAKVLEPERPLEFIAISDAKHFDKSEYDGWAYYIPKERIQSAWDLYYVLLIEYRNDIAHRVGLGKMFKDAFNNSCKLEGKQWKEFILG
jgi:hypothetical protein